MSALLPHLRLGGFGFAFGATVSAIGFGDYGEIHRMFTFADARLLLVFCGAVVLAGIGFAILCRGGRTPARPVRRGTIPGAVLYGTGWAISGGCPGAVLVQIGEGRAAALVTLVGILAGALAGRRILGALRWDVGSCG